ncbi:MAG: flagellar basal body-associated FliL family protein [Candidatus Kapaibacterium sp.]
MAEEEKPQEKQEPVKPQKKKKSSGLSMPVIIGIVIGAMVINVVLVIVVLKFILPPAGDDQAAEGKNGEEKQEQVEDNHEENLDKARKKKEEELEKIWKELEEEDVFGDEEGVLILSTGRITTNPSASTQFIIVDVALEIRAMGEFDEGSLTGQKLKTKTRGIINNILGSMTVSELQEQRLELDDIMKKELQPIYKKHHILLRDIIISEFIIQ